MTEKEVKNFISLTLNKRLIKNSFLTGLALAFVGLIPFAFNFLIARTFGGETLGSINISLSFCLLITTFVTNFFGTSGTKFLAEYRGRGKLDNFKIVFKITFLGPLFILSFISLILFFKWDYLSNKFSLPFDLLFILISYIFLRSYYIIFRRAFYGMDLVKSYTVNEAISAMIMIFSLLFVCFAKQEEYLIECYLIFYSSFCILCFYSLSNDFESVTSKLIKSEKVNSKKIIKSFSRYGLVSMIGTVASTSTGYISLLIIGIHLTHADAGVYSSVLTIVSILMFFPKLFTQVFLPEYSKLFGEGNKKMIFQIFKQSSLIIFVLSALICSTAYVFSKEILSIFGKEFSDGSLVLRILIPSLFIRMISIPFVSFLSGTKYVLYPNIGGIIILITSAISWALLVPEYSLIGIAVGYTAGIIVGIGYQILVAIKKIRTFRSEQ